MSEEILSRIANLREQELNLKDSAEANRLGGTPNRRLNDKLSYVKREIRELCNTLCPEEKSLEARCARQRKELARVIAENAVLKAAQNKDQKA